MDTPTEFAYLQDSITTSLVSITRSASQLATQDLSFHRSLDSSFATKLGRQNARLLDLTQRLLGSATANTEIVRPRLAEVDDIDGHWDKVVDVVDSLLEKADISLDEFTGAVKRLSPRREQTPTTKAAPRMSKISAALRPQDLEKPQLRFHHVPTNSETAQFKPLLESKPHAVTPLDHDVPMLANGQTYQRYPHPYQLEIEQYSYPSSAYTVCEPTMYHPFETTTATFVDTEEALADMLEELKKVKEIAVDLEHHDTRSYIGIVSLMQISTRDRDWIVDTLRPWRRNLQSLNEVFANPNILKVLHGAYMDIMWLQRDLGLYIVGLFDTHYASRALGYAGGSLAFLLKKFADVDAQKQYQTADWRIRPLPEELFDYARSDTHYLLYIFDNMRNELVQCSDFSASDHEQDKLWDVLTRSKETALQRYEHPVYDYDRGLGGYGWYKILARTPALFTKEQFAVFRRVHQWRDQVAREQDDSLHYVLANHNVFSIAKAMPTDRASLLGIAQPATQTIRLRVDELVAVVSKAKAEGASGPDMNDVLNEIEPQPNRRVKVPKGPDMSLAVANFLPPSAALVNGTTSPALSTLPLRSPRSAFWGSAFASSVWKHAQQERAMSTLDVTLTVPMPPLTAQVFADPSELVSMPVRSSTPFSRPSPQPSTEGQQGSNVFILKDIGKGDKKRKRTHLDPAHGDAMATQSDEVAITDHEAEEKAARKAARKARKRAARAAAMPAENGDGSVEDDAPFDYAAAPSVLNPPRESREQMRNRKKKEITPYTKSLDAPKGLARKHKERAGKSMTFKS